MEVSKKLIPIRGNNLQKIPKSDQLIAATIYENFVFGSYSEGNINQWNYIEH